MNSKTILTATLALLLTLFWTCDSSTSPNTEAITEASSDSLKQLGIIDYLLSLGIDSVDVANHINDYVESSDSLANLQKLLGLTDSLGSFLIDSTNAVNYINNYVAYSDSVTNSLVNNEFSSANDIGQYLVYGASVRFALLLEVLNEAQLRNPHTNDSLFVMMGIIPTQSNPSVDSTGLIFSLKSGEDGSYQYFDFTVPCPNACPDWLTDDES